MRFFAVSDDFDTLTGLRLAGIEGMHTHTPSEVRAALTSCLADPKIAVVLITESLAALCPDIIYEMKIKQTSTLVVEIPNRYGTGRGADSITRYIREAIGIKL